jgi:membrane protease subunit (stomatin/prohibitin family)
MAIIDRIKFDGLRSRDWVVYKHPAEDLVYGTQLIVGEGQIAVFVKGGEVCDLFTPGTYTLDTRNLPILKSIVNLPFGGKTPFTAEIFYLNTTAKLDLNWGTSDPVQIIDPKYYTRLRVRAFGQMGLKLDDYETFLRELIGVINPADIMKFDKVVDFFKGILIQKIKTIIANVIINQKISALEITARLDDISNYTLELITPEFARYGLSVVNFFIKSINFPDEDFEEINEILKNKAEFEIMGDNRYVTKRSFDVYDHAASNESGLSGTFAAGGIGIGVGASMGSAISNTVNTRAAIDNALIRCPSCNTENSSKSKFCCECGKVLEQPPKVCISCGASIPGNPKFCPECGAQMGTKTCECGAVISGSTKFCPQCGKKL